MKKKEGGMKIVWGVFVNGGNGVGKERQGRKLGEGEFDVEAISISISV